MSLQSHDLAGDVLVRVVSLGDDGAGGVDPQGAEASGSELRRDDLLHDHRIRAAPEVVAAELLDREIVQSAQVVNAGVIYQALRGQHLPPVGEAFESGGLHTNACRRAGTSDRRRRSEKRGQQPAVEKAPDGLGGQRSGDSSPWRPTDSGCRWTNDGRGLTDSGGSLAASGWAVNRRHFVAMTKNAVMGKSPVWSKKGTIAAVPTAQSVLHAASSQRPPAEGGPRRPHRATLPVSEAVAVRPSSIESVPSDSSPGHTPFTQRFGLEVTWLGRDTTVHLHQRSQLRA